MKKFIADVWNGQTYSLGKHYWLFMVVPSIAITMAFAAVGATSLALGDLQPILSDLLIGITFAVFIVGYVGLINCARREQWRKAAIVAVVLTTFGGLSGISRMFNPFTPNDISTEISLLNSQLPKQMNEMTAFTKASYDYKQGTITFTYRVNADQAPQTDADSWNGFVTEACGQLQGKYREVKKILTVFKYDRGPDKIFQVTQQDCRS